MSALNEPNIDKGSQMITAMKLLKKLESAIISWPLDYSTNEVYILDRLLWIQTW